MSVIVQRGAISLADLAYMETAGPPAVKVKTAIWAYLWACENVREQWAGIWVYPSLNELREALAARPEEER